MTATLTRFPPSQLAVIALAAQGRTTRAIATELGLSVPAVKRRLAAAMHATGAGSRAGLVIQACRWGQLQAVPVQPVGRLVLSSEDRDTLEDIAADLSCPQIAHQHGITEGAARSRCRSVYEQLGARDRAHAVLVMWQQRILPEVAR